MNSKKNPLLESFKTPFSSIPYDHIKASHFLPALEKSIEEAKKSIENKNKKKTVHFVALGCTYKKEAKRHDFGDKST